MKYSTEYIPSGLGFSVGSYGVFHNNYSFQISKDGKTLPHDKLIIELTKLEQKVFDLSDDLEDALCKLKQAEAYNNTLQEKVGVLRKQLRNSKSELTLSEQTLNRAIAAHYITAEQLKD